MKRNLLFIYTDEQAFNTLATYGNARIEMPNLNRLASESTVFDECYITQPVCTPSRSTLLTGLYPHTSGMTENNVVLKSETKCLPEMLPDEYVTAHHGKWHLGNELYAQHGFKEWISIEDGYNGWNTEGFPKDKRSDYYHWLIDKGFTPKDGKWFGRTEATSLPEEHGKPAFLAENACRFLRENKDKPFALYVNFLEPHMPFTGPRDNQYPLSDIPLPPNFDAVPGEGQTLKARLLHGQYQRRGASGVDLSSEEGWKQLIAQYWGLCSLVDTHVGTILDTLDECGLRDNTIVVFTSDHGDMMGGHQLVAKTLMFQEVVRVPFMIRMPGQMESAQVMGPVSQIDVVPTLLDLMDQPIPDGLEGKSLRPWIEDPSKRHDEDIFIQWNGPNNGLGDVEGKVSIPDWMAAQATREEIVATSIDPVRTIVTPDGWKFCWSPLGEHELYNLNDDPGEATNMVNDPAQANRIADLKNRINAWQQRVGDTVDFASGPSSLAGQNTGR